MGCVSQGDATTGVTVKKDELSLSHVAADGSASMVDVSEKSETARRATAAGFVRLSAATVELVKARAVPKGDVFTLAQVAGILAAKRCGELIPLCHPLPLTDIQVRLSLEETGVRIVAEAACIGRTGVEMEAMTAVAVAALTVYDMVKSADRTARIENIRLIEKTGGKSGSWRADD